VASFATLPCETLNATMLQDGENARHNHVLALTLPNIHRFKKNFHLQKIFLNLVINNPTTRTLNMWLHYLVICR